MVMENWRRVKGFPRYHVSDRGRVKSNNGILKPFPFKKNEPYLAIDLMLDGVRFRRPVHQLVLEAFIGPRPSSKHEAIHKNGKGWDNRKRNLRWGTKKENQQDRFRHRTSGLRHHSGTAAKLTADEVADILHRKAEGESATSIHEDYPQITRDYVYRLFYRLRKRTAA